MLAFMFMTVVLFPQLSVSFKGPSNIITLVSRAIYVKGTSNKIDAPSSVNINLISKHSHSMRLALRHAQLAFREKEVPIGAVIVNADGQVIAVGRNQVEKNKDPTAHAEINCIRSACEVLGTWRLNGHTLYTTLEPCPMCLGAIQQSRISKVVYGAKDIRIGALGSWIDLVEDNQHPYHKLEVVGGILDSESSSLIKRFFLLRRRESTEYKILKDENLHDNDRGISLRPLE